ncbi:MAG: pyridoxal-phosphate dependent enzyme [Pseudomonadota bacterium]
MAGRVLAIPRPACEGAQPEIANPEIAQLLQRAPVMDHLPNPHRRRGLPPGPHLAEGEVLADPAAARALFAQCPKAGASPLLALPTLAAPLGLATLHAKDERGRCGLGSFKALGAAHAIARAAADRVAAGAAEHATALSGVTYVCASAGNHGLSMAAGARLFGAAAVVLLADTVPEAFAGRLRAKGARVIRHGAVYDEAMVEARRLAVAEGWELLSDSSWPGYTAPAAAVMEGYLITAAEAVAEMPSPPTHVFLQAGVGGLAAAVAAHLRRAWGAGPRIVVVEPEAAPCLIESVRAGFPRRVEGPESAMGRLDCKEPSHLALACLAREADDFVTVGERAAAETVAWLSGEGIETTPSGAAGVTALRHVGQARTALGLDADSRVLVWLSEGPEEA